MSDISPGFVRKSKTVLIIGANTASCPNWGKRQRFTSITLFRGLPVG